MITKAFIDLIHEAATIQRWNDHIRPAAGFMELDKQAHKMIYAYMLAMHEADNGRPSDMLLLIEGGIFELLQRIILTDIKPPIYYKLVEQKGPQLNEWVYGQLAENIDGADCGFCERLKRYLFEPEYAEPEKRILRAAHFLATDWEFKIISRMNAGQYNIEKTSRSLESQLFENINDVPGAFTFVRDEKMQGFLSLAGQLRFQQRWSRIARIPSTSVMGHMLIVAILSYLTTMETQPCRRRLENNFFGALLHDLPEVLTRDIVSPVKKSVEGLEEIIKDIEMQQITQEIYPLLPASWVPRMEYFMVDEFESKIRSEGRIEFVSSEEIIGSYNSDEFDPMDGKIIRACDHLSAFIEVYLSMQNGLAAGNLSDAREYLYGMYKGKVIGGVDFGKLFDYFYGG